MYCILFLHQTTTVKRLRVAIDRCIASSFYIKPQLAHRAIGAFICCIASSFYIKPQQSGDTGCRRTRCIASSFYIKPQRRADNISPYRVVLHPLSTSNHNVGSLISFIVSVVLHPLSTSNHNDVQGVYGNIPLYCILFLHQTTTLGRQTL